MRVAIILFNVFIAGFFTSNSYGYGCVEGDCLNGLGVYKYQTTGSYDGEWLNGQRHGQGSIDYPWDAHGITGTSEFGDNTSWYSGEWKDDLMDGQGVLVWESGEKYKGQFKKGSIHGLGTLTRLDGEEYRGNFADNKRYGFGAVTYVDGKKRVGHWKGDQYFALRSKWEEEGKAKIIDQENKDRAYKAEQAEIKRLSKIRSKAREEREQMFNACYLDKSNGADMSDATTKRAVRSICNSIADNPSWLESIKYN